MIFKLFKMFRDSIIYIKLPVLLALILICLGICPTLTAAQDAIISVSPSSATPGETVTVQITLDDSAIPPPPPADVPPQSAWIGTIEHTSLSRDNSSGVVTAAFTIPATESYGTKDIDLVFVNPQNVETHFTKTGGFSVVSGTTADKIFVDADSSAASPDGLTWATAYKTLTDGLTAAVGYSATAVWVAEGTYYPTTGTDRTISFELISGIAVYGGFKGLESALTERIPVSSVTTLSGDIGTSGVNTDNSYHVLVGADNATLDGFTVTGGYADGHPDVDSDSTLRWHRLGGGMYFEGNSSTSPGIMTINNCTFSDNYAKSGGAMYLYYYAKPIVSNCTFSNNEAQNGGAILCRVGSDAVISDSAFKNNHADWRGGGLYVGYGANPSVSNTTFTSNWTDGNGGAFYADDRSSQLGTTKPTITGCTFTGNSAAFRGGAISNYNNATYTCITTSTFSNNTAGSGGGAIACESGPEITLIGANTFSGNTGGTGVADTDDNNSACTINTTGTTCP